MRLTAAPNRAAGVLLVVLALAIAGTVHIVSLLALPWRSTEDAFARLPADALSGTRTLLRQPGSDGDRLPYRDPSMLTAVCGYDLRVKPFRLAVSPLPDGFVTIGFHSRHGLAFYGLTVRARDDTRLDLVLRLAPTTADQDSDQPARDGHQVLVTAPEADGFVTLGTPLGDRGDRGEAEDRLKQMDCRSDAESSG